MSLLHLRSDRVGAPRVAIRAVPRPDAARVSLVVERLDTFGAAAHRDEWLDLVGRALEPNAFLDPDFVLPAAQHLAGVRRPCFALVWSAGEGRRSLLAVCPVVARRGPGALASAWMHDLSTLGFPLLDRDRAEAALRALLLSVGRDLAAPGLVVPSLPADGPTAAALRAAAAAEGLEVATLDRWERAVLRRSTVRAGLAAVAPKNAKEMRRQRRRLSDRGALIYASAASDDDVLPAVERFLALEAGGWKGSAGTALLSAPGRTAFVRTAARLLVRRGLCRVDSLALDGAPVAMAVVLSAGDADFLWKIAYREDVARASPGVQLVLEVTDAQRRAGRAAITDSCAVPNHSMIDRLWRDRMELCDLVVATRPGGSGFGAAVRLERAARRLRAAAKRVALAWRRRRARATAPRG